MYVELLAVKESGHARGAGVPVDVRQALALACGEDHALRFRCVDASGAPLDLTTGSPVLAFVVRRRVQRLPAVINLAPTPDPTAGRGSALLALPGAATRLLTPGTYSYSLTLTQGGLASILLPASELTLLAAVLQRL